MQAHAGDSMLGDGDVLLLCATVASSTVFSPATRGTCRLTVFWCHYLRNPP